MFLSDLAMPPTAALALFAPASVIGVWIAWTDMRGMIIPNKAVIALAIAFCGIAPMVLPLPDVGYRLLAGGVILAFGFVLSSAGGLGAGDAKYLAAMAPYVAWPDASTIMLILAATTLAAFVTHRVLRAIPPMRAMTPDWKSWTSAKFPLGMALGPSLAFYLAAAAFL